jgi:hypothetical protein
MKTLLEWVVGEWYMAVKCHHCGWQFGFARADAELPKCPIEITCIECERTDYYCPKEFVEVQGRQKAGKPSQTARLCFSAGIGLLDSSRQNG